MTARKPIVAVRSVPAKKGKKYSVVVSLNAADFREASLAAKEAKQTVALWIADMVNMSTQP